jgi:predicted TIM-barrel fold metal-dependent hydrolase
MGQASVPRTYKVISADGHVLEPGDIFTSRVPSKFKGDVIRVESLPEGDAYVGGELPQPMPFGWMCAAGRDPAQMEQWIRWDDVQPGAYDGKARIGEMEADGIDAEVLFPGPVHRAIPSVRDPELHHAMVVAYNDWMSEFCAHAPDRLGGVMMIPNRGIDGALRELDRVIDRPGFVGPLLSCYPNGTLTMDAADEPLWAAVEATGKPLIIHVGLIQSAERSIAPKGAKVLPGTGHFYDAPVRMLEFIFNGVLDRHPDLHIVFAEVDCGWIPYFEAQADDNFLRHARSSLRDANLKMLPSEYMHRHYSATFITDPVAIETRHRIGIERMMWSNDYPHITSDWPTSWKTINASFASVPVDERQQILADNARRIFGFTR